MRYVVDSCVCDYGVYEMYYTHPDESYHKDLKLICKSRSNAKLIAEIMNADLRNENWKSENVEVKHDVLTKDDIKDPDPEDNVFVDAAESIKQAIALVKEDQEKFIFEAIVPFLEEINEIVIPKRVLERALFTFKEKHTAEWKALMKEYGGTDIYDLY